MKSDTDTLSVNMKMSSEFVTLIDDWRRVQPKLPSRNEAVRTLILKGLETEAAVSKTEHPRYNYNGC
jgi:hypothetical protein